MDTRLAALEGDLGELRNEFSVTVERLETAIRFNAPVYFAFDDATVRTEDHAVLDRFADVVVSYYSDAIITVEGFTDSSGSAAYNQQLGERRANAVRDYLASAGIPSDQMRTVSYGLDAARQVVPGAIGPGDGGWQNRRVAMVVDFGGASAPPVSIEQPTPGIQNMPDQEAEGPND
jgi:peptidoglycan-associated lipoprotein